MSDVYSFGNTVINLFSGWEDDDFYHFYIRKQVPRNSIVKEYFNISSVDALKGFLKRNGAGRRFSSEDISGLHDSWEKARLKKKES